MPCCSCNRRNAVCKRCVCARAKRPCSTCLPTKEKKCSNTLPLRVDSVLDSSGRDGGVSYEKSDGLMKDDAKSGSPDDHVSLTAEARYDFYVNASSCIDGASSNSQG